LPAVQAPAGVPTEFGGVPVHEGAAPHTVPSVTGVWHTPVWQVSTVQALPSLPQAVPFATFAFWQPSVALQESVVHAFESLQLRAAPAWHTPLKH